MASQTTHVDLFLTVWYAANGKHTIKQKILLVTNKALSRCFQEAVCEDIRITDGLTFCHQNVAK